MTDDAFYHPTTPQIHAGRKHLAPGVHEAFEAFSRAVFADDGALPEKTKQLIAIAVAHVMQCPYCITRHTRLARSKGAIPEEIMEAIWVAAEMRADGAYAHARPERARRTTVVDDRERVVTGGRTMRRATGAGGRVR
ncbi:carboxymuconolactone decarboxylase family protein [Streptomyces sp. NPDC001530]|uniref:carboxymuconolactone decarboxylase family protein n=1 Tax=Streptomyces sp. NPDC001530 TaxID=3364582 RepID=UPI0036A1EDD1